MRKIYIILSLIIILIGLFYLLKNSEIVHPPGILAPDPPQQTMIKSFEKWSSDDYEYTALANFEIKARVLSIRSYGYDDMSEFCPVDIAVGWGKMSDQAIVDKIDLKQQHRWYVWQAKHFPIPRKEIERSSTNIHVIPASNEIEDILDNVIMGNIIFLKGKLVNVKKNDEKFVYKTSINRKDTGGGACEILWAENIKIIKQF